MKKGYAAVLIAGATATAAAQQAPATAPPASTFAVETRVTTGAPYSAEAITEFTQPLVDGNRIRRQTTTRTFRDNEGRTRREVVRQTAAGESVSITINDPVARVSWLLDPGARTATRMSTVIGAPVVVGQVVAPSGGRGGGGRGGAIAPAAVPSTLPAGHTDQQRADAERTARVEQSANSREASASYRVSIEMAASGNATSTKESLGTQLIEGVMAEGTRTTTVIPAGGVGNAQPITIVSEQWFSPDLQVFVLTRHSDPRSGETVYRLANIVRGEQDRSLFEVPADYTVRSRGGLIAPMRQQ